METAKDKLDRAYGESWVPGKPNSGNCSGFIKSLAAIYGFSVKDGQADDIIQALSEDAGKPGSKWTAYSGIAGVTTAAAAAAGGALVLACMTAADYEDTSGHVAVVLPKRSGPHNAPLMYGGGSPAARSQGSKTIREVWRPAKHDKLQFYQHKEISLGRYD